MLNKKPEVAVEFFIPAKTFLVGEYSVLVGGDALGLATSPGFQVKSSTDWIQFHPQSAAGLMKQNFKLTLQDDIKFPGFGKSTAEFIALWGQTHGRNLDQLEAAFQTYRNLFQSENKILKPSGADLVTQMLGGVAHFNSRAVNESQSLLWPFPELSFKIIATGLKQPTHEHIKNLDLEKLKDLPIYSNAVIEAFKNKDLSEFLEQLNEWCKKLNEYSLTSPEALKIKAELEAIPNVILAKPCGALGIDVMLVFYKSGAKPDLGKYNVVGSERSLTKGVLQ